MDPTSVERYFASRFGDMLESDTDAMQALASARTPAALAVKTFKLTCNFDQKYRQRKWLGRHRLVVDWADSNSRLTRRQRKATVRI